MKSFVVMTYYHFMHATAMALCMDERPNLYFAVNYLGVSDDVIQRIADTGVFSNVVALDHSEFAKDISTDLYETEGLTRSEIDELGNSIFEEHIEPYYAEMMAGADLDDEIFVYNDFQFYYYYISKHFKHIVGVEDGYKVLEQQMRVHKFKGVYVHLRPFIDAGYYPKPLWRNPHVERIISSCEFENLDSYYQNLIVVKDFYELIEQNRERFIDALKYIFDVDLSFANDDASILIGQPLDRCQYCNSFEYYLFNRKLIEENECKTMIIKPHPAELLDFSLFENDSVTVINKSFPIELLNYCGVTFKEGVSFDSTSLNTLRCIERHKRILDVDRPKLYQVKASVQRSIAGQKLKICVVVKVSDIELECYVNAFSYYSKNEKISFEVIVALDDKLPDEADDYYIAGSLGANIREYLSSERSCVKSIELNDLIKGKNRYKDNTYIRVIRSPLDDELLLRNAFDACPDADYYFCTDATNLGIWIADNFLTLLKKHVRHVVAFPTYFYSGGGRRALQVRNVNNLACHTTNMLIHKSVLAKALEKGRLEYSLTEVTSSCLNNVSMANSVHLSDITNPLLSVSINQDYFSNRIKTAAEYAANIDDDLVRETFLTRMYSSIVDEYITWQRLTNSNYDKAEGLRFVDELGFDPDMKDRVIFNITDALYIYRGREYVRYVYRESDRLTYYKEIDSWLLETNIARRLEAIRRFRMQSEKNVKKLKKEAMKQIKGKKKKVKKRIRRTLRSVKRRLR